MVYVRKPFTVGPWRRAGLREQRDADGSGPAYAGPNAALALEIDDPGAGRREALRRDLVDLTTDFA